MRISDNVFLFNKSVLPIALRTLRENPFYLLGDDGQHLLFSPQEQMVMEY